MHAAAVPPHTISLRPTGPGHAGPHWASSNAHPLKSWYNDCGPRPPLALDLIRMVRACDSLATRCHCGHSRAAAGHPLGPQPEGLYSVYNVRFKFSLSGRISPWLTASVPRRHGLGPGLGLAGFNVARIGGFDSKDSDQRLSSPVGVQLNIRAVIMMVGPL